MSECGQEFSQCPLLAKTVGYRNDGEDIKYRLQEMQDAAFCDLALWSNPAWVSPETEALHTRASSAWVGHHRTWMSMDKVTVAQVIGSVRGVIPDSKLAQYGDYRYDFESEEMYAVLEDESTSEESSCNSVHFASSTLIAPPYITADSGIKTSVENEILTSDISSADGKQQGSNPVPEKAIEKWLQKLRKLLGDVRRTVGEQVVLDPWTHVLLHTCLKFLKAVSTNKSLQILMETEVPFIIDYEQLLKDPVSKIELLSIPQPYLEESYDLEAESIDSLWLNLSSLNIRKLWLEDVQSNTSGNCSPNINDVFEISPDSVAGVANFLRRSMRRNRSNFSLENLEIPENKAKELLGSLLPLIDGFISVTGENPVSVEIPAQNCYFPQAHGKWTENLFPHRANVNTSNINSALDYRTYSQVCQNAVQPLNADKLTQFHLEKFIPAQPFLFSVPPPPIPPMLHAYPQIRAHFVSLCHQRFESMLPSSNTGENTSQSSQQLPSTLPLLPFEYVSSFPTDMQCPLQNTGAPVWTCSGHQPVTTSFPVHPVVIRAQNISRNQNIVTVNGKNGKTRAGSMRSASTQWQEKNNGQRKLQNHNLNSFTISSYPRSQNICQKSGQVIQQQRTASFQSTVCPMPRGSEKNYHRQNSYATLIRQQVNSPNVMYLKSNQSNENQQLFNKRIPTKCKIRNISSQGSTLPATKTTKLEYEPIFQGRVKGFDYDKWEFCPQKFNSGDKGEPHMKSNVENSSKEIYIIQQESAMSTEEKRESYFIVNNICNENYKNKTSTEPHMTSNEENFSKEIYIIQKESDMPTESKSECYLIVNGIHNENHKSKTFAAALNKQKLIQKINRYSQGNSQLAMTPLKSTLAKIQRTERNGMKHKRAFQEHDLSKFKYSIRGKTNQNETPNIEHSEFLTDLKQTKLRKKKVIRKANQNCKTKHRITYAVAVNYKKTAQSVKTSSLYKATYPTSFIKLRKRKPKTRMQTKTCSNSTPECQSFNMKIDHLSPNEYFKQKCKAYTVIKVNNRNIYRQKEPKLTPTEMKNNNNKNVQESCSNYELNHYTLSSAATIPKKHVKNSFRRKVNIAEDIKNTEQVNDIDSNCTFFPSKRIKSIDSATINYNTQSLIENHENLGNLLNARYFELIADSLFLDDESQSETDGNTELKISNIAHGKINGWTHFKMAIQTLLKNVSNLLQAKNKTN